MNVNASHSSRNPFSPPSPFSRPRPFSRPKPRPGRASPVLRLLFLLLATLLLAAAPTPAHADGCTNCPRPTLADLQAQPGFVLEDRPGSPGHVRPDTYYVDRGQCVTTSTGTPVVTRGYTWLVLRGSGEVWHCPHSKSVDAITVESSVSDSSEWSFTVKIAAEFRAFAAKIKAEVEAGRTTGVTITEVTSITKTITPAWCHRITWEGWFEVGTFKAETKITTQQRFAWWTKNLTTGDKVHAKGSIWKLCGSQDVVLSRRAPIAGYFALRQRGCADPECYHVCLKYLGYFPLLPAYLAEPAHSWKVEAGDTTPPKEPDGSNPDAGDSSGAGAAGGNTEPDPTTVDGD